jgi:hypothetical protein
MHLKAAIGARGTIPIECCAPSYRTWRSPIRPSYRMPGGFKKTVW